MAEKSIDIVYVIGSGSKWQDNELRYSLRSVQKFGTGVRDIYIIGRCPGWVNTDKVCHVYRTDGSNKPRHKERNIKEKIEAACRINEISSQFLFMNDDHFMLERFDARKYPFYKKQDRDLYQSISGQTNPTYKRSIMSTYQALSRLKCSTYHLDIHCPIRYKKDAFVGVMKEFDWEIHFGYLIKSLYGNTMQVPVNDMRDCKINRDMTVKAIFERIQGRSVFSIGDKALRGDVPAALELLFPEVSKYEL